MSFTSLSTINDAILKQDSKPSVTCLWTIENFSYYLQNSQNKKRDYLRTPPFEYRRDMQVVLRPFDEDKSKFISIFFQMSFDYGKCDLELSLISADGSCFKKYEEHSSRSSGWHGKQDFIEREELFKNRNVYLPNDTLTICCRLYVTSGYVVTGKYFCRTSINVNKRTFPWYIPIVSQYPEVDEVHVNIHGTSHYGIHFFLKEETVSETKLQFEIKPRSIENSFLTFKIDIMDAEGTVRISLQGENRYVKDSGNHIWNFPTFVTKGELLSGNYLKNGRLSLRCELAVSFGEVLIEFDEVQSFCCLGFSSKRDNVNNAISSGPTSLMDDILCMYEEHKWVDATLCAAGERFPVHRVILSARSPVFSRMFDAAFKEGQTGVVEIPDVDADTTRRMLHFIYTDSMEDLGWEEASSLYSAADKYDIQALRMKCISLLESKLSVSNVCEALLLAELHQGQGGLRNAVQDFVVANDKVVLQSEEWGTMQDSHPLVTAKVLRQVYLKNKQKGNSLTNIK